MLGFGPGSRNVKIGTIYQRVKGFLKSGAFHETDKPVWFDVWEAFPPAVQPSLDRPVQKTEVPEIIYPEDAVRAKFLSIYERPLTSIKNENPWKNIKAEVFVNEYIKRQSPNKTADEVTRETIAALQTRDIHFPLKGGRKYGEEDMEQAEMLDTSGRPVIKRSRPKFSIDFSDLIPGELPREITPPSAKDDAIISDKKQRVDSENIDAEVLARVQARVEARRRVSNAEEMDSVIEDLLDEPETRKIKFEDFYGKDDVDFEFEDELTDSDSSKGGVDRDKK